MLTLIHSRGLLFIEGRLYIGSPGGWHVARGRRTLVEGTKRPEPDGMLGVCCVLLSFGDAFDDLECSGILGFRGRRSVS